MTELEKMGARAKKAARVLASAGAKKSAALLHAAECLSKRKDEVLAANEKDMNAAVQSGMSPALQDRLRLTADGKLKPCLHAPDEYNLKGLDRDGMRQVLEQAVWNKPAWHGDLDALHRSRAGRNMNQIGG